MPYKICSYDRFKRSAYDSELAVKAFPDEEDGLDYYRLCVERDETEYVYQQAALYLAALGDYTSAFRWIDRASNLAHINHFTIEATHAEISFMANIDNDVREAERALSALGVCCEKDRRKAVHFVKYADMALDLAARCGECGVPEEALPFIEDALGYVDEGLDERSSHLGKRNRRKLSDLREKLLKLGDARWSAHPHGY